jgi:hypothetical protein
MRILGAAGSTDLICYCKHAAGQSLPISGGERLEDEMRWACGVMFTAEQFKTS